MDQNNTLQDQEKPQVTQITTTLSSSQQSAVKSILDWFYDRSDLKQPELVLGGYAGTGKTTVIKAIVDKLRNPDEGDEAKSVCVSAFTGKAVSVLHKKGLSSACTLHSLMYTPVREDGIVVGWERVKDIPYDVCIVDEASMINTSLYDDLKSFRRKVLYVGDMGQLEPIGDNPYIMANPNVTLTEIHRQAAQSPIVQFSVVLRSCKPFKYGKLGDLKIVPKDSYKNYIYDVEQVICGLNRTRIAFNEEIRANKNMTGVLCVGDRLICLRNNRNKGVYNGMIATVTAIKESGSVKKFVCDLLTDGVTELNDIEIAREFLGGRAITGSMDNKGDLTYWDYGYAITAHKAQGSEWDSVMVYEEVVGSWDYSKWTYTAATRAAEKLIYCC